MEGVYTTSYCNHAHRLFDGKPVAHECYILPKAALRAEMDGDTVWACTLIERAKVVHGFGEPSLRRHAGVRPVTSRGGRRA